MPAKEAMDSLVFTQTHLDAGLEVLGDSLRLDPRNPFGLSAGNLKMTRDIAAGLESPGTTREGLVIVAKHLGFSLVSGAQQ